MDTSGSSNAPFHPFLPGRARQWRLRTQTLELPERPLLMGIVNVTPDSFSDGGCFGEWDAAVDHALRLAGEGADILDIGGESTRPYSRPVSEDEELRRVIPVIKSLCRQTRMPVSVDTSKASVARAALDAGAEIINDVTGFASDQEMISLARTTEAGVCAMHMRGSPQDMQDDPRYDDVVTEIVDYLRGRRQTLLEGGIDANRICLDPGIGFGKTHQHNLELVVHAARFHELRSPILVGHSRKGFLAKIIGDRHSDRTAATVGVSISLACRGIQILRVHDVRSVREALVAFLHTGGAWGDVAGERLG